MIWTGDALYEIETSFSITDQPCPKALSLQWLDAGKPIILDSSVIT
jgi:hypothetical protein